MGGGVRGGRDGEGGRGGGEEMGEKGRGGGGGGGGGGEEMGEKGKGRPVLTFVWSRSPTGKMTLRPPETSAMLVTKLSQILEPIPNV